MLATELLIVNAAAKKYMHDHELHQIVGVIQMGRKLGMHTIHDSLFELYEVGEVTYGTAINNSHGHVEMGRQMRPLVLQQWLVDGY
jgi:Tfp pilus assembly pilus retraction ATPase PilT